MKPTPLIRMQQVGKQYHLGKTVVTALSGIDISIEHRDFMVIAGTSGSGKTTLLNLLGLIDSPTSGTIFFNGESVGDDRHKQTRIRRDSIGYIFQTFNLVPVMNVYENVAYPLILKGVAGSARRELVERALSQVGLSDRRKHKPRELSGGQRQRVAIARAIVKDPGIVLADEPTANLDSSTGGEILDLMTLLNEELGTTFVFSSHDPMIIAKAKTTVRLHDGRIEQYEVAA
ncbi:ABC transporter ATP-binding protein [bacterium]|nr:ABC transporter ATP-binding protein [bacterium]